MEKRRYAIMIVTIGDKYYTKYEQMFKEGFERYAARIDAEIFVVREPIVPTTKRGWWQKLVPFEDPRIAKYDKVAVIDYDIYIPKHARNVFEALGDKPWGICKSNPYDLPKNAIEDMYYFESCPKEGRPPFAANGGMIVLSREYKEPLKRVYDTYSEIEARDMEAGPLFYFLYNDGKGEIMDISFNTPVALYIQKYGCALSAIMDMYENANFIHFVGGKWHAIHLFVRWYDNTHSRFARAAVGILRSRRWDWLTASAFRLLQWMVGVYDYRIKKYLNK